MHMIQPQSLGADVAGNGSVGACRCKRGAQASFWLSGRCVLCLFLLNAASRICPLGTSLREILPRFWEHQPTTAIWQDLSLNLSSSLHQKHTGHLHKTVYVPSYLFYFLHCCFLWDCPRQFNIPGHKIYGEYLKTVLLTVNRQTVIQLV